MSDPGRVTWQGTCATDGCEHKVQARRIPKDTPAPPADTKTTTGDDPDNPKLKVVDYGKAEPPKRGARRQPEPEQQHVDPPAPTGGPVQGAGGGHASPDDHQPPAPAGDDQPVRRAGLRDRLAAARARRAERPRGEYRFSPFGD